MNEVQFEYVARFLLLILFRDLYNADCDQYFNIGTHDESKLSTGFDLSFFRSFAATRPAALCSLATFMSLGAVVRNCLICVGIMGVALLISATETAAASQEAVSTGTDVTRERIFESSGASL